MRQEMINNIRNWNNQPETIRKIENAFKRQGIFGPEHEIDSIEFIQMQKGPGLNALVEISFTDGEFDYLERYSLKVNRKGEFA